MKSLYSLIINGSSMWLGSNDNACYTATASQESIFPDSYTSVKRALNSGKLVSVVTGDNNTTRMLQGNHNWGNVILTSSSIG